MRTVIFLFFLVLISFNLLGEDTYKIILLDLTTGQPLKNAKVSILKKNENYKSLLSNYLGVIELKLNSSPDTFELMVFKEGYSSKKYKLIGYYGKVDSLFIESVEYFLPGIVVVKERGSDYVRELHHYENIIENSELQKSISSTLALTLRKETDIFIRSMGPATSKPVFRGLGLEYSKIFENEIPVRDLSSTAPDHSTAVDPVSFEKIELLRGPKLLIYTNNAIGGMINLGSKDYLVEKVQATSLRATSIYESAFDSKIFNFQWEVPISKVILAGSLGTKNTHDMYSGKGIVPNTYFKSKSGNFAFGNSNQEFSVIADGNFFNIDYGVPGGFVGAHPKGVDIVLQRNTINFKSLIHTHTIVDNITFAFSRSYYHHTEYEKNKSIGSEFLFKDYFGRLNLNFQKSESFNESIFGITFNKSFNDYGGYVFTPSVHSFTISSYFFQNIKIGKHYIDYSLRYDHKEYYPEDLDNFKKNPPRSRTFNNFSFSALVMHNIKENSYIGFNFGLNERFPSIEELYSNGPHLAAYSFEIGNTNVDKERAFFGELSYNLKLQRIDFSTSVYWYEFTNYLFPRNTGEINVSQLLPIYRIESTYARLFGFSVNSVWKFSDNLNFKFDFAFSRGFNRSLSKNLPMIPPPRGKFETNYKIGNFDINFNSTFSLKQNFVDEFEKTTPGYIIFSGNIRYLLTLKHFALILNLNIDNIFNATYYNHLSRIKEIFPEPGRNIRLLVSLIY